MREYGSKRTGAARKLSQNGRTSPREGQLPNSLINRMMKGNDSISAGEQKHMGLLESSIRSRMPVIPSRMQEQIPQAESEAERLSANIRGLTPDSVKTTMGRKLGANFSAVRFHTDAGSAAKADAMGARAFTAGGDVYFGSGGYEASAAAHELVHTVQQGAVEGAGVSAEAPLGGVQMLPNPFKWIKRKIKGQTVAEQEAEEQKEAELKQIREERGKADAAEKANRGAPHGAEANKRSGILDNLKHGAYWLGNAIASPFRGMADAHHKALDDLNLNQGAYKQLSGFEKFKHTVMNPLAHMRSRDDTLQDSVKRHMQNSVLNDIEAYGVQRERGTSGYSGANVVNLRHVESPDVREEKRRQMIRQQYLAEKAGKTAAAAPEAASEAAPAVRPRSNAVSGGRSPVALNHVPRPDMSNPGQGPVEDGRFIDTAASIAGMVDTAGSTASDIGKDWKDTQKTAQETFGLNLGGRGFMEGQAPVTGMIGGAVSLVGTGKEVYDGGKKTVEQFRQGDIAGGVRHGLDTTAHVVGGVSNVINAVSAIPGLNIADSVVPGLGLAVNALQVGTGAAQGIRGTMTASNTDKMMDELQYQEKHGQALSQNEQRVFKSAKQMRGQATVDQMEGYTKALSGTMKAAGGIATLSGAGAVPGAVLSAAATATDFIGGKLADSAAEDVQHTVANQEVNLDQDVNERLKNKYSEEQWRGMSQRERDEARNKEQRVMLRYHGQKHGDLEQFTVEESQKRARDLAQGANSGDGLSERLIKGSGLSKGSGGKYDEKAVGRKLYSRKGEDLDEAKERLEKEHSSEIQAKLRKQRDDKAKGKKWYQFWK